MILSINWSCARIMVLAYWSEFRKNIVYTLWSCYTGASFARIFAQIIVEIFCLPKRSKKISQILLCHFRSHYPSCNAQSLTNRDRLTYIDSCRPTQHQYVTCAAVLCWNVSKSIGTKIDTRPPHAESCTRLLICAPVNTRLRVGGRELNSSRMSQNPCEIMWAEKVHRKSLRCSVQLSRRTYVRLSSR